MVIYQALDQKQSLSIIYQDSRKQSEKKTDRKTKKKKFKCTEFLIERSSINDRFMMNLDTDFVSQKQ